MIDLLSSSTPFQWITIPLLLLLALRELAFLLIQPKQRLRHGLKLVVCVTASGAIIAPDMITNMAMLVGVGRGADLVLYIVALSFAATTFYFYARYLTLQNQITELVRHLAISEACSISQPNSEF